MKRSKCVRAKTVIQKGDHAQEAREKTVKRKKERKKENVMAEGKGVVVRWSVGFGFSLMVVDVGRTTIRGSTSKS